MQHGCLDGPVISASTQHDRGGAGARSRVVGKEGRLSQRVSFKGTDQAWGDCIESVNSLIEEGGAAGFERSAAR